MANDEEEWNEFNINNSRWVIPIRYSNIKVLGKGTFGLVL